MAVRLLLRGTGSAEAIPVPGCACRVCLRHRVEPASAFFDDGTGDLGTELAIERGVLWAPGGVPEDLAPAGITLAVIGGPHRAAATSVARLRRSGALVPGAHVVLLHPPHDSAPAGPLLRDFWDVELPRRGDVQLRMEPGRPRVPRRRMLLIGGSGSGKSALAEDLLAAEPDVLYLATGPAPGPEDAEWAARVTAHRERRPTWWRTAETLDAAALLRTESAPVLFDAVGTWLAGVLERCGAWEDAPGWRAELGTAVDDLVAAWRDRHGRLVAVSDEVGSGVVPESASGRLFRTELGRLNQRLAAESDSVRLVVAGQVLALDAPWPPRW